MLDIILYLMRIYFQILGNLLDGIFLMWPLTKGKRYDGHGNDGKGVWRESIGLNVHVLNDAKILLNGI